MGCRIAGSRSSRTRSNSCSPNSSWQSVANWPIASKHCRQAQPGTGARGRKWKWRRLLPCQSCSFRRRITPATRDVRARRRRDCLPWKWYPAVSPQCIEAPCTSTATLGNLPQGSDLDPVAENSSGHQAYSLLRQRGRTFIGLSEPICKAADSAKSTRLSVGCQAPRTQAALLVEQNPLKSQLTGISAQRVSGLLGIDRRGRRLRQLALIPQEISKRVR